MIRIKNLILLSISGLFLSACATNECVTVPCSLDNLSEQVEYNKHHGVGYKEGTYQVDDKTLNVGVWYDKAKN